MATDLTQGPVGAHLRRQATPMAIGLIAIFSFDAVDLFFVSRLGDAPLAAISFTFPVIWFLSSIIIGFEAGAASVISRAVGKGDTSMAARQTTDTVILAGIVSFVLCMIALANIEPLFHLLGATDDLMPLIHDYMGLWLFAEPAAAILWTTLASMRARGNSLLEGKIITTAAIVNAILDPIFIFGLFGFPRMEIAGAALATLVANLILLVGTLTLLSVRLKVFASPFASLREILDSWREMLHVGIPAMITNVIVPVSNGVIVALVAGYGVDAVAGFGIAMRVEPTCLIVFFALSAVTSPFMGQNSAAHRIDRLAEARRTIARFCLLFGLAIAITLSLLAVPVTSLFTDNEAIQRIAVRYLWIMAISYGAYGLVMAVCAAFNGMGTPLPGVAISATRVLFLLLPLALAGQALFGVYGLFLAASVSNLLVGAMAFVWLGYRIRRLSPVSATGP